MIAYDVALEELQHKLNINALWLPKHHLTHEAQELVFAFDTYLYGVYANGLTTITTNKPILTNVFLNGYLPIKTQFIKAQTTITANRVCVFHFGANTLQKNLTTINLTCGLNNSLEINCVPHEKVVLTNGQTLILPTQKISYSFNGDFSRLQLDRLEPQLQPKTYNIVMEAN